MPPLPRLGATQPRTSHEADDGDGPPERHLASVPSAPLLLGHPSMSDDWGGGGPPEVPDGPRFEVLYLVDLGDEAVEVLKRALAEVGDAVAVVGGDGAHEWSCHVHTDEIGAAIEAALDLGGRPRRIRVTDLFGEAAADHRTREAAALGAAAPSRLSTPGAWWVADPRPAVTAVVAVAPGESLRDLLAGWGVCPVVSTGAAMAPSATDLVAAIESVAVGEVVLLPNHPDVIAAAEAIAALATKVVKVVPTRSVPEGLAALGAFRPSIGAEDNAIAMSAAAALVITGEVTVALSDAISPAGRVRKGDVIGLSNEGIVAIGVDAAEACRTLLTRLLVPSSDTVTVVVGEDADRDTTEGLLEWLTEQVPHLHVEVVPGGQPSGAYLFGIT